MGLFDGISKSFTRLTQNMFNKSIVNPFVDVNGKSMDDLTKTFLLKFFDVSETKSDLVKSLDEIKEFYFTQLIIDRIIEDALNPQVGSSLFDVKIKNKEGQVDDSLTELVTDLNSTLNLDKVLVDVAFDLLLYGEYILRTNVNSFENSAFKGVINLYDDVDISSVLPVFRDSDISYYLVNEVVNKQNKIVSKQPTEYIYFSLPGNRIKVKVEGGNNKILHLRMGKSIIYPVFGLLKELRFLEEIIPQQFINNLIKTKLVSVAVPSKTKPSEAINIAQTFQKLINNTLTDNDIMKDDKSVLDELKKKVGNVKVIPNFGDKGQLEEIDFNQDNYFEDIFEKIMDIRKNILITTSIPPGILDEDVTKGDNIQNHVRYTKKLKSIQEALKEGLIRLYRIHLTNNGFDVNKNQIQISFLNTLNTDDLEKLEYIDLMISMLDNFKGFVSDFEDDENIKVNYKEYTNYLNKNFENILGFSLFEYKENDSDDN